MKDSIKKCINVSEWMIAGGVLLVAFLVFYYTDFSDTLDNSIMLFDCVLDGHLREYYHYAAQNHASQTVYTANYNIFLYGLFALWNLPAAILHRLNGFDYMSSAAALLWCKLMILITVLGITRMIGKIMAFYVKNRQIIRMMQILFLLNTCVIIPTMVAVQYDVLSILAMLLGVYHYLKGEEKRFILWFMIAMPLKSFAIFIFLPLLMLREKRIPMLFLKTAAVFLIQLLCAVPFYHDAWYESCMGSQNRDAINLLLGAGFGIGGFTLNLFVLSYVVLLVACYIIRIEDGEAYIPLWCAFFAMASIILFMDIRSYWVVMIVPFAVLCCVFHKKRLRENLLLLVIGTFCYGIYSLMHHWIYSIQGIVSKLALSWVMQCAAQDELKYKNIQGFFKYYDLQRYADALRTVFFISVILLLVLNFPYRKFTEKWKRETYVPEHWLVWLQAVISAGVVILMLYANLAVADPYIYHVSQNADDTLYVEEAIGTGTVIWQEFTAKEDGTVKELSFVATNTNTSRANRDALIFTLTDAENGTVLTTKTMGAALIRDGDITYVKLDKTTVEKGHRYILVIEGESNGAGTIVQFPKTEENREDCCLLVDQTICDGNLAFDLR